jgi:hypothetical protein
MNVGRQRMKINEFLNWKKEGMDYKIKDYLYNKEPEGAKAALRDWYSTYNYYLECLHFTEAFGMGEYDNWKYALDQDHHRLYVSIQDWEEKKREKANIL